MLTHLHIDPFAGIAGDMFLGALIHAGLKLDDLRQCLAGLKLDEPYDLSAAPVLRQGIAGIDFKVHVGAVADAGQAHGHDHDHEPAPGHGHDHAHDHDHDHDHPHEHAPASDAKHGHQHSRGHRHAPVAARRPTPKHAHPHHHVHYADMLALVERLNTTSRGRERARRIIDVLARSEATVHAKPVEQVHFHEVGAIDSIVDMLGAAAGLELMGIDTVSCGAMPISRGFVRCDHGKMPVPAPATAYLLRGMPTFGVDRNLEMITPTGAAIAAALSESFGPPPPMTLRAIGYGAGDRDDADLPNLLRVFIGERR